MSTRPYDFVIFDLDGTIADTKADLGAATNHTLRALGLPEHSVEEIATFVGGGLTLLFRRALGPHGNDEALVEKGMSILRPYYRDHVLDATTPYPGTMDLLDGLRAAGIPVAIATNKPRMFTAPLVKGLFDGRFDPIVACGSSPDDDAPRKPDPTCIRKCQAKYPAIPAARTVYVGDTPVDIEVSRNAGLDVCSVSWGYATRDRLEALKPTRLLDSNAELRKVLLG